MSFWPITPKVKQMLKNTLLKTIRDRRRSLVYWTFGLLLLALTIELTYPAIRDSQPAIQQFMNKALPENLSSAFAYDLNKYGTPAGYLNMEMFFFLAPVLILVFTIGFGTGAIAGEEEKGTLDLLLSFPLPRWRQVVEKAAAMVILALVLVFVLWAGLSIGARIVNMEISLGSLAGMCLSTLLLGIDFGMIALAVGSGTGSAGLAMGVTVALAVSSYLVNGFSTVVDLFRHFQKYSLFFYYIGGEPLASQLNPAHIIIMLIVAIVFLLLAILGFRRRDIAA
jgi:ABC-2 type transport system permease protein